MKYATNFFEEVILNVLRGTTYAAPSEVYVSLLLGDPTEAGLTSVEASYVGYSRQKITFGAPYKDGLKMTVKNVGEVLFPAAQSDGGTVLGIGIHNSRVGGDMLVYGKLEAGDELVIKTGFEPTIRDGQAKHSISGSSSDYFKTCILNSLRGINITGINPHVGLVSGDIQNGGTEFTGRGYNRIPITFTAPEEQESGDMQIKNSVGFQFNVAEEVWGIWNQSVIFDASISGNPIIIKKESGNSIKTNDRVKSQAGAIKVGVN